MTNNTSPTLTPLHFPSLPRIPLSSELSRVPAWLQSFHLKLGSLQLNSTKANIKQEKELHLEFSSEGSCDTKLNVIPYRVVVTLNGFKLGVKGLIGSSCTPYFESEITCVLLDKFVLSNGHFIHNWDIGVGTTVLSFFKDIPSNLRLSEIFRLLDMSPKSGMLADSSNCTLVSLVLKFSEGILTESEVGISTKVPVILCPFPISSEKVNIICHKGKSPKFLVSVSGEPSIAKFSGISEFMDYNNVKTILRTSTRLTISQIIEIFESSKNESQNHAMKKFRAIALENISLKISQNKGKAVVSGHSGYLDGSQIEVCFVFTSHKWKMHFLTISKNRNSNIITRDSNKNTPRDEKSEHTTPRDNKRGKLSGRDKANFAFKVSDYLPPFDGTSSEIKTLCNILDDAHDKFEKLQISFLEDISLVEKISINNFSDVSPQDNEQEEMALVEKVMIDREDWIDGTPPNFSFRIHFPSLRISEFLSQLAHSLHPSISHNTVLTNCVVEIGCFVPTTIITVAGIPEKSFPRTSSADIKEKIPDKLAEKISEKFAKTASENTPDKSSEKTEKDFLKIVVAMDQIPMQYKISLLSPHHLLSSALLLNDYDTVCKSLGSQIFNLNITTVTGNFPFRPNSTHQSSQNSTRTKIAGSVKLSVPGLEIHYPSVQLPLEAFASVPQPMRGPAYGLGQSNVVLEFERQKGRKLSLPTDNSGIVHLSDLGTKLVFFRNEGKPNLRFELDGLIKLTYGGVNTPWLKLSSKSIISSLVPPRLLFEVAQRVSEWDAFESWDTIPRRISSNIGRSFSGSVGSISEPSFGPISRSHSPITSSSSIGTFVTKSSPNLDPILKPRVVFDRVLLKIGLPFFGGIPSTMALSASGTMPSGQVLNAEFVFDYDNPYKLLSYMEASELTLEDIYSIVPQCNLASAVWIEKLMSMKDVGITLVSPAGVPSNSLDSEHAKLYRQKPKIPPDFIGILIRVDNLLLLPVLDHVAFIGNMQFFSEKDQLLTRGAVEADLGILQIKSEIKLDFERQQQKSESRTPVAIQFRGDLFLFGSKVHVIDTTLDQKGILAMEFDIPVWAVRVSVALKLCNVPTMSGQVVSGSQSAKLQAETVTKHVISVSIEALATLLDRVVRVPEWALKIEIEFRSGITVDEEDTSLGGKLRASVELCFDATLFGNNRIKLPVPWNGKPRDFIFAFSERILEWLRLLTLEFWPWTGNHMMFLKPVFGRVRALLRTVGSKLTEEGSIGCDELRDFLTEISELEKPASLISELAGLGPELLFGKSVKPESDLKICGLKNFPKSSETGVVANFGFGAKAPPIPLPAHRKNRGSMPPTTSDELIGAIESEFGPHTTDHTKDYHPPSPTAPGIPQQEFSSQIRSDKKRRKSKGGEADVSPNTGVNMASSNDKKGKQIAEEGRLKRQRSESRVKSLLWKFESKTSIPEPDEKTSKRKLGQDTNLAKKTKEISLDAKKPDRGGNATEEDRKKGMWSFLTSKDSKRGGITEGYPSDDDSADGDTAEEAEETKSGKPKSKKKHFFAKKFKKAEEDGSHSEDDPEELDTETHKITRSNLGKSESVSPDLKKKKLPHIAKKSETSSVSFPDDIASIKFPKRRELNGSHEGLGKNVFEDFTSVESNATPAKSEPRSEKQDHRLSDGPSSGLLAVRAKSNPEIYTISVDKEIPPDVDSEYNSDNDTDNDRDNIINHGTDSKDDIREWGREDRNIRDSHSPRSREPSPGAPKGILRAGPRSQKRGTKIIVACEDDGREKIDDGVYGKSRPKLTRRNTGKIPKIQQDAKKAISRIGELKSEIVSDGNLPSIDKDSAPLDIFSYIGNSGNDNIEIDEEPSDSESVEDVDVKKYHKKSNHKRKKSMSFGDVTDVGKKISRDRKSGDKPIVKEPSDADSEDEETEIFNSGGRKLRSRLGVKRAKSGGDKKSSKISDRSADSPPPFFGESPTKHMFHSTQKEYSVDSLKIDGGRRFRRKSVGDVSAPQFQSMHKYTEDKERSLIGDNNMNENDPGIDDEKDDGIVGKEDDLIELKPEEEDAKNQASSRGILRSGPRASGKKVGAKIAISQDDTKEEAATPNSENRPRLRRVNTGKIPKIKADAAKAIRRVGGIQGSGTDEPESDHEDEVDSEGIRPAEDEYSERGVLLPIFLDKGSPSTNTNQSGSSGIGVSSILSRGTHHVNKRWSFHASPRHNQVMRLEVETQVETPTAPEKRDMIKRNRRSLHVPMKSASSATVTPVAALTTTTTVTLHNSNPGLSRVPQVKTPEDSNKIITPKIGTPKDLESKKRRSFPSMTKLKQLSTDSQTLPPLSPSHSPTHGTSPRKTRFPDSTKVNSDKSPRLKIESEYS